MLLLLLSSPLPLRAPSLSSDELAVYEKGLGRAINKKLEINCIYNDKVLEIMRGIRGNLEKLLGGTTDADLNVMSLPFRPPSPASCAETQRAKTGGKVRTATNTLSEM